jgi:hypothetical protein
VALGNGNNVTIGSLPGATVDVLAFDGNNNITIGKVAKLVVHVGGGNNNIDTGNTSPGDRVPIAPPALDAYAAAGVDQVAGVQFRCRSAVNGRQASTDTIAVMRRGPSFHTRIVNSVPRRGTGR